MLVSLKKFVVAAAVASVFSVSLPAQQPQAQGQGQDGEATDGGRGSVMRVAEHEETNPLATTLPRIAAPERYL